MRNINVEKILVPERCTNINIDPMKNEVLFIGYNYHYPNTIRHTLKIVNRNCDVLLLDKNIETYSTSILQIEYNKIFENIKETIMNGRYKYFVFDIPNVNSPTDYSRTKQVISYLKSKGKLLLINSGSDYDFEKIFGNIYNTITIKKKYIVDCGSHLYTKNLIHSIL